MRVPIAAYVSSALVVFGAAGAAAGISSESPTPATLLARHTPVIALHPDERFVPVPVDGFLADSDVERKQADGSWAPVQGTLPSTGGPWRLDQRLCDIRDGLGALGCYADAEAAHAAPATVYGAWFRRGARIALQYWLFYPLNAYSPEVPQSPEFAQLHEGDWEMVTLLLDSRGAPQTAAYSRHCAGAQRAWAKVPRRGQRPVVYVALGSHANYFSAGATPLEERCWPKEAVIVFETYGRPLRDFTAKGRTVVPRLVQIGASRQGWMRFPGAWGEDQIIDFPDARFTYGLGPVGPAFHAAWRRPVSEPLSWPRG